MILLTMEKVLRKYVVLPAGERVTSNRRHRRRRCAINSAEKEVGHVSVNQMNYEASTVFAAVRAQAHTAPTYGGAIRTCGPDARLQQEKSAFTPVLTDKSGAVGDVLLPKMRRHIPGIPPRSRRT